VAGSMTTKGKAEVLRWRLEMADAWVAHCQRLLWHSIQT